MKRVQQATVLAGECGIDSGDDGGHDDDGGDGGGGESPLVTMVTMVTMMTMMMTVVAVVVIIKIRRLSQSLCELNSISLRSKKVNIFICSSLRYKRLSFLSS